MEWIEKPSVYSLTADIMSRALSINYRVHPDYSEEQQLYYALRNALFTTQEICEDEPPTAAEIVYRIGKYLYELDEKSNG